MAKAKSVDNDLAGRRRRAEILKYLKLMYSSHKSDDAVMFDVCIKRLDALTAGGRGYRSAT